MALQQHPGLRAINFPVFPAYAESRTQDVKTGYRSYSRAPLQTDTDHALVIENEEPGSPSVLRDGR